MEDVGRESGENGVSEVKGIGRFMKKGVVMNVCLAKSSITQCLNHVHRIMYFVNHHQPQGEQCQWKAWGRDNCRAFGERKERNKMVEQVKHRCRLLELRGCVLWASEVLSQDRSGRC